MLEEVRLALRISNTVYNDEIQGLIDAGKRDLEIAGVALPIETDPLIKRAVILYCKAHFGYDNKDADRFLDSYVMLKQHLVLSGDYNALG